MASGGGPPPTGGFGRGGRGMAIMEALKREQAQKPGQAPQAGAGGAGRGGLLALGRAAALQKAAEQPPLSQPPSATPAPSAGPAPQPLPQAAAAPRPGTGGRGNAAGLLALMQQQKEGGPPAGFRGRGGLMAQATLAAQKPAGATALGVTAPGATGPEAAAPLTTMEGAAPVGAMARMGIGDTEQRPLEPVRQPAVSRRGDIRKVKGNPAQLAVNYIRLRARNRNIYQYHVNFTPIVDSKGMRVGLLNEHKDKLPVKLFDGTIMFLPNKLDQDEVRLTSTRRTDGAPITILIRLTKELPIEQCPQLYNILLRKILSLLQLVQVGRYYYNPATPSQVPRHKLEVWPGYITSIREQEGGLLLLLDSSHRVLRCQTVLDLMAELHASNSSTFQEQTMRKVIGCTVLTRYNNKTYRVDDIDWSKTPQHSFQSSDGREITFAEYYQRQYGKQVDPTQPLLIHRPKPTKINGRTVAPRTELICLIPELCHLTGLTDDLRANHGLMKDLSAHTRSTPAQRLATMKKFVDSVNGNAEARQQLENWGLSLDDSALAVEGGRMKIETICFGNGEVSAGDQADWNRELTRKKVITGVELRNWVIFFVRRNGPDVTSFLQEMSREGPKLGIRVDQPIQVCLPDDKTETLIQAMRKEVNPKIQLVCVVMPTKREDKYAAVKKFTCVTCPVPSQVVVQKTLTRNLKSVVQKIVLQINCKLGGELWAIKNPLETAMVVGIDSFHDVSRGRNSIGGFVASTNKELTRWFSRCMVQMKGEELVPGLQVFMVDAIRKYHEMNHKRPEKIIVYRDGVGDGQMSIVQDYEVRQMQESFRAFGADYSPKLTVVIVQKRINTRIFMPAGKGGHLENPPPGTVLDHTVTRRDMYDFFLVSQHVRQGTVSPTHYVVVHDEINLPPERMQVMSYKMTHMYYNWPGTVRVPAPCLYAHKLAYLVGESIHGKPSELLSDRLFFL